MTTDEASALSFLDIHRQHELEVTSYLSEDLKNNWQLMWSPHVVNPEKNYVETKGYLEARKRLWYTGWVTLCGHVGDGKSSMAEHLICNFVRGPWKYPEDPNYNPNQTRVRLERQKYVKLAIDEENRECYTPVFVNSVEEYKQKVDHDKYQIVLIDDIFGEAAFDWTLMEQWRTMLEDMLWNIAIAHSKTLVVICVNKMHLQHAPGEISQMEWFRENVMIDLSDKYKPTTEERVDLMNSSRIHLMPKAELERSGHHKATQSIGLVYRLFNQVKSFSMEGQAFFRNPWKHCSKAIDGVYSFDKIMYYTLCVAVLLDGKLDLSKTRLQEYDPRTINIMEQLIPALKLPEQVDLAKMRSASRLLTGFFFNTVKKWAFEFTHPKVYYLVASSLCKMDMKLVLQLASSKFLISHIRALENNETKEEELVINCPPEHYKSLAQRVTLESLGGNIRNMIKIENFENKAFVKIWFETLREFGQLDEILRYKEDVLKRTILYWGCFYGRGILVTEINNVADELNLRSDVQFKKELIWGLQASCGSTSKSAALVVECLVEQGVYVNLTENYQGAIVEEVFGREMCMLMQLEAAPIHTAALKGHPAVIQILIDKGGNMNEATADGCTPLHRAAMRRDHLAEDVIKLFIKNKADLNVQAKDGNTPIDKAIKCGSPAVAEELLKAGAEIDDEKNGKYLLALAAQNGQYHLVEILLKKGIPPDSGTRYDDVNPTLSNAVYNRDMRMLQLLLDNKTDPNKTSCIRWPPLHLACYHGELEIAKYLIEKGADVNTKASHGHTPLHCAAAAGMIQICEFLLANGAKPEIQNDHYDTALVVAAKSNQQMVVWMLLREGMMLGDEENADDKA